MNLEDEIATKLSHELSKEIDWELMCDMMTAVGWTKIETSWSYQSLEDAYDLKEWCAKNIEGHYQARGKTWMFANNKDAVKFALRWI